MKDLWKQMQELTVLSGVSIEQYRSVIIEIDEYTEKDKADFAIWLANVKDNEYKAVWDIYKLLPKHIWEQYKRDGFNGEEVIRLRRAQKVLRGIWHKPFRSGEQLKRIASKHNPIKRRDLI